MCVVIYCLGHFGSYVTWTTSALLFGFLCLPDLKIKTEDMLLSGNYQFFWKGKGTYLGKYKDCFLQVDFGKHKFKLIELTRILEMGRI